MLENGKELTSGIILPQHLIGIAGFIGMSTPLIKLHSGEVRAVTAATYCKVKTDAARKLLDNSIARAEIFDMIGKMMRWRDIQLATAYSDVTTRLSLLLCSLGKILGKYEGDEQLVLEGFSHDDIAVMINTTRPNASRILEDMHLKGLVRVEHKKIVLALDLMSAHLDLPQDIRNIYFHNPL